MGSIPRSACVARADRGVEPLLGSNPRFRLREAGGRVPVVCGRRIGFLFAYMVRRDHTALVVQWTGPRKRRIGFDLSEMPERRVGGGAGGVHEDLPAGGTDVLILAWKGGLSSKVHRHRRRRVVHLGALAVGGCVTSGAVSWCLAGFNVYDALSLEVDHSSRQLTFKDHHINGVVVARHPGARGVGAHMLGRSSA